MHACRDYSGSEIMRVLRDEVLNRGITVVDFTSAIELIKDADGKAAGAVLMNMETKEILVARAKTVVIATGGAGRLHYQGFPTSNHYGATADGLVLAYRAGAKLLYPETLQYHPTGAAVAYADLRRFGYRKSAFAGRAARQQRRYSVFVQSAGDARRHGRLDYSGMLRKRQRRNQDYGAAKASGWIRR